MNSDTTAGPAGDFDLSSFESAETAVLDVQATNGEPLTFNGQPVQIEMYGPGSERAAAAQVKIDRAAQTIAFQAAVATGKGRKLDDMSAQTRELQIEKLVAVTKELINFPVPGGARALYENQRLGYITRQAEKFQGDWANFPAACTKTSASTFSN